MTEEKRKVGRPRKNQIVKPDNPDCEPATKGFVKCLIRRTRNHNHPQDMHYKFTLLSAMIGWVATALAATGWGVTQSLTSPQWYPAVAPLMVFSVVCTVVGINLLRSDSNCTSYVGYDPDDEKLIQKWEPPKCEKKECE